IKPLIDILKDEDIRVQKCISAVFDVFIFPGENAGPVDIEIVNEGGQVSYETGRGKENNDQNYKIIGKKRK
ncbi:MAG: hypothetical protein ABRQ37_05270, partial [Candidatus Eremiobacterota bacterium]